MVAMVPDILLRKSTHQLSLTCSLFSLHPPGPTLLTLVLRILVAVAELLNLRIENCISTQLLSKYPDIPQLHDGNRTTICKVFTLCVPS